MNDEQHVTPEPNELDAVKAQAEEYLSGWKRAQADYANLKKEHEREKLEYAKYANERLLDALLPAVDQYETALRYTPDITTLPDDEQKKLKNWIIGLHAVKSLWEGVFQSIGLEKVRVTGEFDPQLHEAVGEEPSGSLAGQIVRIEQDGWSLNGKLLRPAKVIVSTQS